MKCRLLLVLATLPLVVNSYNFIEIPHTAAIQNVGKLRTVCGKVQSTYINSNTASQRIYSNMGREYPNHTFTGLIWYSSNKDTSMVDLIKNIRKKIYAFQELYQPLMKNLKFKLILKIKLKYGSN